jgi:hypothetical protein
MAQYRTYHPDSSNLRITNYNSDTKIMRILFKSGYLYFFYGVPKRVYDYVAEGSPRGGKRFWKALGYNYPYRQINQSWSIDTTNG